MCAFLSGIIVFKWVFRKSLLSFDKEANVMRRSSCGKKRSIFAKVSVVREESIVIKKQKKYFELFFSYQFNNLET